MDSAIDSKIKTTEKDLAIVILAAGSIKGKYSTYSFIYNSPALVPIASRSTLSFILAFYENISEHIYVAINKNDEVLFRKELQYYSHIHLVPIDSSTGVCDTLFQTLSEVTQSEVIVNLGTTIPSVLVEAEHALFDEEISEHLGYSGLNCASELPSFVTKAQSKSVGSFQAFTGILRHQKSELQEALGKLPNLNDLIELVIWLRSNAALAFQFAEWIDTGHEINYAAARRKLISSRSFNAISVNNQTGILTKRSQKVEKLLQEIRYVEMLPAELKILYPRIIAVDAALGSVQMEYYGYPNLAEYQLYRSVDAVQWARIFDALYFSLKKMASHTFSIGKAAFMDFYWSKTTKRVDEFFESLPTTDVLSNAEKLLINGVECQNYQRLSAAIEKRISDLYNEDHFSVMHGDFCFNNILFDTVSETVKLIDPRGSFGDRCVGIYGDQKYDLAKLMHSTMGCYDYIVNNLFHIEELKPGVFNYSFSLRDNQSSLNSLSDSLVHKMGFDQRDILFIVGLLFLSMCPLHADNAMRQRLMYLHGLSFVNKYL